ncbi:GLPGLI family protein [Dyadobacter sandarakinus]|uniref:GLPGLI family protein n=1 Tax=Dyadobacter sandarakinus TaxID=2747268 RepID=A0ABX7I556_9BACT|nr:GLPGLI family protein [Dyadobacter sandarakinus]QRR01005.1 GLPGLI family protein [Dyadobacter sandarakinus]
MKAIKILILICTAVIPAAAQQLEGEVTYEKVFHWTRIYSRLTYLSNEEKDRMKQTWGNDDEYKEKMTLLFNEKQSFYTYKKKEENEGGYSWNREDYRIYRNLENGTKTDIIQMIGKTYIVEDSIRVPSWKIMNKIKEVAGHMCMMAVTEDTIKSQKITAWFANDIALTAGPELYTGLPGMILELEINDGDITVSATELKMRPVPAAELDVSKKLKGKKITNKQYDSLVFSHIQDSMKAHRNPFWALPY